MTKSEKRYFTLDAQKSGKQGAQYLLLFKVLSEMESYDEVKLKKKFKNLSSDKKSYLYDSILRSMRDYRSQRSKSAQIKEKLLDSRYLFERGLYRQSDLRLIEAADLAKELGDDLVLMEIVRERLQNIKKGNHFVPTVIELLEEIKDLQPRVNQYFHYSEVYYSNLKEIVYKFGSFSKEERMEWKEKLQGFIEMEKEEPKSSHAQKRFYQSLGLYYQILGENKQVLHYFEQAVAWWKDNKAYKNEEFFRYVVDVFNLLYGYQVTGQFEKIKLKLDELENEKPQTFHEQKTLFETIYHYRLTYLIATHNYQEAHELIPEIEEGIKKYELEDNLPLIGNIAVLFFHLGSYKRSCNWLRRITDSKSSSMRQDVIAAARLLQLVILIEEEEIDVFDNRLRSATRYFKKIKLSDDSVEYQSLRYLQKICHAPYGKIAQTKADFLAFLQDHGKATNPLIYWLKNKMALSR